MDAFDAVELDVGGGGGAGDEGQRAAFPGGGFELGDGVRDGGDDRDGRAPLLATAPEGWEGEEL